MAKQTTREGLTRGKGKDRKYPAEQQHHPAGIAPYQIGIVIVASIILLILFLYTIQIIVSPFLVLGIIIFLLYPLRHHIMVRRMIWVSILLFLIWFAYMVIGILIPFIISFGLAYVVNPYIDRIERKGIPRWVGALGVLLIATGLVVSGIVLLMPLVIEQFNDLIRNVTGAVAAVGIWLREGKLIEWLAGKGIPTDYINELLEKEVIPKLEDITVLFVEGAFNILLSLSGWITQLINMVIIPFLTFYLIKDFNAVKRRVRLLFPEEVQPDIVYYYRKIDMLLGRYVRGYIVLATINGVLAGLLLWIFGIKYPVVLGVITALLDFIPYFGLILTMIIAAIVAFLSEPPVLLRVMLAILGIGALAVLENYVLSPFILGKPIGMHPVVLILCLLVFGFFLGFVGLLIALPTTAIIILLVKEWDLRRRERLGLPPIEYTP
jgi:predicted PurR-regulated permease PerM